MEIGKLNWDDLKLIIDNNRGSIRDDVIVSGGIGEDCSVIRYGDYDCVVSTDPITAAQKGIGKLAVNINCNDIASAGVKTVGILVTIMAPKSSKIEEIKNIMSDISDECKKFNIQILGGHTEITEAVNRIIVSCTAIGKGEKGKTVFTSGAEVGDDIIVTKTLGMEGTYIAINEKLDKLKNILSNEELDEGKSYGENLSVIKEGEVAGKFGVNSMHDITEGGLLGALWEVANASKVGFKVYNNKLPISHVTGKVAKVFGIDILRFISSGSMLICCKNGEELLKKLQGNNVPAFIIGNITSEKGMLVDNEIENEVTPPECDELFKIYN
ncbi:AIR synthase [Clostridium sp. DMHC 10]|uniref:AIR synthase family protein n=1 Tax=Clostridium sp. DMHC 10 TaxID=747377 RepID=UPI00069E0B76|nr:AIR synthase family protein [Clostridium sp. DMHC 10]KOF58101.1 AIR synthase [Clostridium sp. DMHC 10]